MGNCVYYNNPYNNNTNRQCLICWDKIKNFNYYVKCKNCNICLHYICITTFNAKHKQINNKCPHCQKLNVLYLYFDDDCKQL